MRILGKRKWESKGEFDKYFGGGANTPSPGAEEGQGKNPGGIGDSGSGAGGGGAQLPPGLARGPDPEGAPSLYQQFEAKSKEWRL